jgi:hypothetical protein
MAPADAAADVARLLESWGVADAEGRARECVAAVTAHGFRAPEVREVRSGSSRPAGPESVREYAARIRASLPKSK